MMDGLLANLLREEERTGVELVYWLSFVDIEAPKGEQFRGICMVKARGPTMAVMAAHALGINPGGEVKIVATTREQTALILAELPHTLNKLHRTRAEAQAVSDELSAVVERATRALSEVTGLNVRRLGPRRIE